MSRGLAWLTKVSGSTVERKRSPKVEDALLGQGLHNVAAEAFHCTFLDGNQRRVVCEMLEDEVAVERFDWFQNQFEGPRANARSGPYSINSSRNTLQR